MEVEELEKKLAIQERLSKCISEMQYLRRELEDYLYNLEGKRFSKLKVLKKGGRVRLGGSLFLWEPEYQCVCDCGQEVIATHRELMYGLETSCIDCEDLDQETDK